MGFTWKEQQSHRDLGEGGSRALQNPQWGCIHPQLQTQPCKPQSNLSTSEQTFTARKQIQTNGIIQMSTSGVPGTGILTVRSITMLHFMAGNTLFRLEIKISTVRTGWVFLVWVCGVFFLLKGKLVFLMHKLPMPHLCHHYEFL